MIDIRQSVLCLAIVVALAACGELGIPTEHVGSPQAKPGNGNGGGPPGGGSEAVPGVAVDELLSWGGANPMLGDGRDYTGALDAALGEGGQYKDAVCNVVVSILAHSDGAGDPDTIAARYHAPFKAPKRPRGECVLGGVAREITYEDSTVVAFQANWQIDQADELGEVTTARGKLSIPGCTFRLNPPVPGGSPGYPGTELMAVERIQNGWRVSSQGSIALCQDDGTFTTVVFEMTFVEDW